MVKWFFGKREERGGWGLGRYSALRFLLLFFSHLSIPEEDLEERPEKYIP